MCGLIDNEYSCCTPEEDNNSAEMISHVAQF